MVKLKMKLNDVLFVLGATIVVLVCLLTALGTISSIICYLLFAMGGLFMISSIVALAYGK